jgi:four helix bundle protein
MTLRKNINRGYMKLRVWDDAKTLHILTCRIFRPMPYDLRRIVSQQIASVDSIHRNIAEGYCRRSINEYLHFLNIAQASAGESVSALHVYVEAEQLAATDFESLDALAFKLENGLKRLIESLQMKRQEGGWKDSYIIRESNVSYTAESDP